MNAEERKRSAGKSDRASLDSFGGWDKLALITAEKLKTKSREEMMLDTTLNARVQVLLDKFEAALAAAALTAASATGEFGPGASTAAA